MVGKLDFLRPNLRQQGIGLTFAKWGEKEPLKRLGYCIMSGFNYS
jgi:hypothetical protein